MSSDPSGVAALQPPPGQQSNFDHASATLQPTIIGTLAACLFVSTVCMLARGFAQLYLIKRLVWADFWIVLAWASHVAFCAMLLAALPYGAGHHQWDVRLSDYYKVEFYLYVSFVIYDIAIVGAKVSILLQLSSLFAGNVRNRFYWVSLFLILVNLIFYVALSFALIFQCSPLAKAWNPTVNGKCLNQDSLLTSSGPFNIISDFLIFLLPIWAIWRLHLPMRRRLEVISAFTVGLFGCICSAVRVAYSDRLAKSGDSTWVIMQNQLWANAEITTGVLICSIFILPRFIRHMRGHGTRSYTYDNYGASGNEQTYNRASVGPHKAVSGSWAVHHRSPTAGARFARDPYFELEESERGDGSSTNLGVRVSDVAEHERDPKETVLQENVIRSDSKEALRAQDAVAEGGILRTVDINIETAKQSPVVPGPVAIPGITHAR